MPLSLTRRELARAAAGTALMAGTPLLVREVSDVLIDVLARFRNDVLAAFRADELETLATVAHEVAAGRGIATFESAAAAIAGRDVAALSSLSPDELRALIGRNVRRDFASDDVVNVGGWQLARTELLIVALTVRKPLLGRARV